jgi:hypothetical protein
MTIFRHFLTKSFFAALLASVACSKASNKDEKLFPKQATEAPKLNADDGSPTTYTVSAEVRSWDTIAYKELIARLPEFDLNQDISDKSIEELRILRNTVSARKGYLFMNADLRYYFYNTGWYRQLMEARWYGDCEYSGLKPAPPISYSVEETAFIDRVKTVEEGKLKQNYIVRDGLKYANVKNIVNAWQFGGIPSPLLNGLDKNGFAIVPNKYVQLFHTYEQNDYSQTQNFVTTDLYLQLFHMHFSMMLRGLEEDKFVPILERLTRGMVTESIRFANAEQDQSVKSMLEYNQAFYAVSAELLEVDIPLIASKHLKDVDNEIASIKKAEASISDFIPGYRQIAFPYDQFKPRGHYTRTEGLKKYFQTMQWLQKGEYCLEDDGGFKSALSAAFVLCNGISSQKEPLLQLYQNILEPTTFLIGEPDNLSLLDFARLINSRKIKSLQELMKPETIAALRVESTRILSIKNVIKPKIENTCPGKINFMPARFVLDNEILQEMTDLEQRPYPKGLDVMAAFGSKDAENILTEELKETEKWEEFLPHLDKMKSKYKNYEDWDVSVYAKWINGLDQLLLPDKRYPSFMQLPSWGKKNLNTALASWAELKHDAILYTENPGAAECGGGGECDPPPEPYTLGYVEPNVNYWKSAISLLNLTSNLLQKNGLLDDRLKGKQSQLMELCQFLLAVSEKEVRGEKLLEQEYRTIERIGSSVEYITLSIFGTYYWDYVSGPDKEIAVVADIYTNNQRNKPGILHAAVGYGNDLYVVVEIEGYLYLTKGSTFSYYEFPMPLDERLTDEEWQEMLKSGKVFPVEPWMNDLIIELDKSMEAQVEEYLYSSGC